MDDQPDPVAEARAAVKSAQVALAQADRLLRDKDRENRTERRGRPRGGMDAVQPLNDLATHPAPSVTVRQLANYWAKHTVTIGHYIRQGRLKAKRVGHEYRVYLADALAFERNDKALADTRRTTRDPD
jgi:hypothetical protein